MPRSKQEADTIVEQRALEMAPWLGGYFEAGGYLGFNLKKFTYKGRVSLRAYPVISTKHKDPKIALTYQEMFGGSVVRQDNSLQWIANGIRAYSVALAFAPYAPSRREFMEALSNWISSNIQERVQIARDMKGYVRFSVASTADYNPLTNNSEFLAGVVDNRGTIVSREGRSKRYPHLDIYSSNRPLLENLSQCYGGQVRVSDLVGESRIILGRRSELTRDSLYWRPASERALKIFDLVTPHLRFKGDRIREILSLCS